MYITFKYSVNFHHLAIYVNTPPMIFLLSEFHLHFVSIQLDEYITDYT